VWVVNPDLPDGLHADCRPGDIQRAGDGEPEALWVGYEHRYDPMQGLTPEQAAAISPRQRYPLIVYGHRPPRAEFGR
jgi:hypothetical protein